MHTFSTIHVHVKVEKELDLMSRQDNAPKIAARRAYSIIKALIGGAGITRTGRLSLRKDTRIRHLYKFDLGKGFRLLSIKGKQDIYMMFVGTHDQCDRWLDANSKKTPQKESIPFKSYRVVEKAGPEHKTNHVIPADKPENKHSRPEPSQEELRRVFCGLVSSS